MQEEDLIAHTGSSWTSVCFPAALELPDLGPPRMGIIKARIYPPTLSLLAGHRPSSLGVGRWGLDLR